MKELSVAVLGSGRWAKALTGLLIHNQTKHAGQIRRVVEYSGLSGDHADLGAAAPGAAHRADSDDATMTHLTADVLSRLQAFGGAPIKPAVRSDSDDATMTHLTADALSRLQAVGGAPIKPAVRSGSDDATMMHLTADALAGLQGKAAVQSGTEDATIMKLPAGAWAALAGAAPGRAAKANLRADSEDETMMGRAGSWPSAVEAAAGEGSLHDVSTADLLLLAVPAARLVEFLRQIRGALHPHQQIVHCVGSFVPSDAEQAALPTLPSAVIRQETSLRGIGALAGPALPADLEEWNPAALVCGSTSDSVISAVRQVLGCTSLRIYGNSDPTGVEVAAAMSSTVALGSGICHALQLGGSARALLVSRVAVEIARLGTQLGAEERTFLGLAGFGNFMLASETRDGVDFQLGMRLGAGARLAQALLEVEEPCESVNNLRDAYKLAQSLRMSVPILTALHQIAFSTLDRGAVIQKLLDHPNTREFS